MKFLDLSLPTPAANLACDEALLNLCEAEASGPVLRFWEPPAVFVVVGYANRAAREVKLETCRAAQIPVLRRCSGGGTIVQGAGCLNYSLIFPISDTGPFRSITSTNTFVMEEHRRTFSTLLQADVQARGHTDLALAGRKFSGNAQRRRSRALLFHGTFLLGLELALIEQLLPLPSQEPAYRQHRSHQEFLTNLPLAPKAVKAALRNCWQADSVFDEVPWTAIEQLVAQKYETDAWNLRH